MIRRDRESSGSTATPGSFGVPGQYDDNGVDLSLIRANMRITPTQRARRAERARRAALRVQALGRASRAKPA
jgi:hypothetical protein